MSEEITITIQRSDEWVAKQRLATGTNIPVGLPVKVKADELTEECRRIVLAGGGGSYPTTLECLHFNAQYKIQSWAVGYGRVYFQIDSDSPTVAEIDAAILAAAQRIEEKRAEAEAEKQSKIAADKELCREWASLPVSHRTDTSGPVVCFPFGEYKAGDRLSRYGTARYDLDNLKKYEPAAVAESITYAEHRKQEAERKKAADLEALKAWAMEHGSELTKARLAEGYDSWQKSASDDRSKIVNDYADSIVAAIPIETGEEPGHDEYDSEDRLSPTLEEIEALRIARANVPAGVTCKLIRETYTTNAVETDYGEEVEEEKKEHRTAIYLEIRHEYGNAERFITLKFTTHAGEKTMNAREQLEAVVGWLSYQSDTLSFGLRSMEDAIKLHSKWRSNNDLPEFCDDDFDDDGMDLSKVRRQILGYDPMRHATGATS